MKFSTNATEIDLYFLLQTKWKLLWHPRNCSSLNRLSRLTTIVLFLFSHFVMTTNLLKISITASNCPVCCSMNEFNKPFFKSLIGNTWKLVQIGFITLDRDFQLIHSPQKVSELNMTNNISWLSTFKVKMFERLIVNNSSWYRSIESAKEWEVRERCINYL